jgi:phosphoglycerol transferase MdoB-like AlkP superfamily enzyme
MDELNETQIPNEYKPISMWGYFGYEILFSIPLVGFVLLLVFSFGGTANKNLKNFARSYFCFIILIFVLILLLVALGVGSSLGSTVGSNL